MEPVIDQNTAVSLGLVITVVGAVVWLTKMFLAGKGNQGAIAELTKRVAVLEAESSSVCERLARIETKLDLLIAERK